MSFFLNYFKEPLEFIDRDKIRMKISECFSTFLNEQEYFKIFSLYGISGVGKSRLFEECINEFKSYNINNIDIIHLNLEIVKSDNLLDILIKMRKKFPVQYLFPLFDSAMLSLWGNLNTSKLDDSFIKYFKSNIISFFKNYVDLNFSDITELSLDMSVNIIIDMFDNIELAIANIKYKDILKKIKHIQPNELISYLPEFMAIDIKKQYDNNKKLVFVIDNFEQYIRYTENKQWLMSFISNLKLGLFLINSRERINWDKKLIQYVLEERIDILPSKKVKEFLISNFDYSITLIENIVSITDCLPVFLDIAINTINASNNLSKETVDIFFENKEDLTQKFLDHLDNDTQKITIILAIVGLFDQQIFEHLVKDLNIPISILLFNDICSLTMIQVSDEDDLFYKMHDTIAKSINNIADYAIKQRIIDSYIKYIRYRGIYQYNSIQVVMLYKHILNLIIFNNISINISITEILLDIFLYIKQCLIPIDYDSISGIKNNKTLQDIFYFTSAIYNERSQSIERLKLLEKINITNGKFGKHIKSYKIIKGYLQSLCISSVYLKNAVEEVNSILKNDECLEWYYGQAKIYLADSKISYGNFKTGISILKEYRRVILQSDFKANDLFQSLRHIGHAYRFNMYLKLAEKIYTYAQNQNSTTIQKVYILTNLCETKCYFKYKEVLNEFQNALNISLTLNDYKSIAKIHYAAAISFIQMKDYTKVKYHIKQSILFNKKDGYKAGELFSYLAKSYYEYSRFSYVHNKTLQKIYQIQAEIKNYKHILLPIAMMTRNTTLYNELKSNMEWVHFKFTIIQYKKFLHNINKRKSFNIIQ